MAPETRSKSAAAAANAHGTASATKDPAHIVSSAGVQKPRIKKPKKKKETKKEKTGAQTTQTGERYFYESGVWFREKMPRGEDESDSSMSER